MRRALRCKLHLPRALALTVAVGVLPAPIDLAAQITITVPAASITDGKPTICTLQAPSFPQIPDTATITFKFVSGDTPPKAAKTAAVAAVQIDGVVVDTIVSGKEDWTLKVAGSKLASGTVTIMRADAQKPLCSVIPWPAQLQSVPNTPEYTSFVVDGELGKVLRGGAASQVTGSIGVDHRSLARQTRARPASRAARFFGSFAPWRSNGEELHAVLTVAGSADSLIGEPAVYGAALLAPSLSGSGSIQGASVDYHFFHKLNQSGGTWGPRLKATFARSLWQTVDTVVSGSAMSVDTLRQPIPLSALDVGVRLTFINHLVDEKENTYAVGLDLNYLFRVASPNSADDYRAVRKALGSTKRRFWGGGGSFWIRLRHVTATADFPYIRAPDSGPVDGLTRFQPTVTIRYSSALFKL